MQNMPSKKKTAVDSENGDEKQVAFVISPIGEPDSPTRKRADQILNYVIEPVVSEFGYKAIRADKISKPGVITSQIIDHLLNDHLVIADLTGRNPNVFYELAVRHTVRKPIIQMIQEGERIPFDVSTTRTIQINHEDLTSVDKATKELRRQIEAVEKNPTLVDSPISMAVDLQSLKQSSDPESKTIVDLSTAIQEISLMIKDIQHQLIPEKPRISTMNEPLQRRTLTRRVLSGIEIEGYLLSTDNRIHWIVTDKMGIVSRFDNYRDAIRFVEDISGKSVKELKPKKAKRK